MRRATAAEEQQRRCRIGGETATGAGLSTKVIEQIGQEEWEEGVEGGMEMERWREGGREGSLARNK
eukprot:765344-Hanusia_phi.AAC.2